MRCKFLCAALLSTVLLSVSVSGSQSVNATTADLLGTGVGSAVMAASVGGGTWNYGVGLTGTFGYSDYLHNSKTHSASVGRTKSDCNKVTKTKGVWAQSKYTKIPPTGLNYWWSVS